MAAPTRTRFDVRRGWSVSLCGTAWVSYRFALHIFYKTPLPQLALDGMASRTRTLDSFSTRSASASLIFQGLQVQTLKPASVGLFSVVSADSESRASRISFPSEAQLLEAKANLLRLRQDIPLADAELSAVEDGLAAYEELLSKLADVPTPAGPTPRQLGREHLVQLHVSEQPTRSNHR